MEKVRIEIIAVLGLESYMLHAYSRDFTYIVAELMNITHFQI